MLATSRHLSQVMRGNLTMMPRNSGLEEWLQHHGINLQEGLVLDPQNSAFPVPVTREVGGFSFQEVRMLDYPFFVDVRGEGLNTEQPITSGLPQLTLSWASPLTIDKAANSEREVIRLLQSSPQAWTSTSMDILPRVTDTGLTSWQPEGPQGEQLLGVLVSGRFNSWFAGKASPLLPEPPAEPPAADGGEPAPETPAPAEFTVGGVIEKSPESARIILFASNDFLTDQILGTMSSMSGGQYMGPLELIANTLDWSLEDGGLLGIRSNAHFNRTLPPMEKDEQLFWEYLNYGLAVLALLIIAFVQRQKQARRAGAYLAALGEAA